MAEVARQLTPEEEKQTIRDIAVAAEAQTKVGDTFFLITQRWWQEWLEYVNHNQTSNVNDGSSSEHHGSVSSSALKRPSCIDNSDLIDESASEDSAMGIELHDTLVEGTDYILLPQEVWNQLYLWYGGGPVLARKVINTGLSQAELSVEVYPLRLQLHLMPKGDRSSVRISKKETIGVLHRRACEIFDLTLKQVSIWDYFSHKKHALMNDMEKTLDDANIQMDQDKHLDITSHVPFLYLDDMKKMKLCPLLLIHKEAPDPDSPISWNDVPCISTKVEFPIKRWVHVGCEVLRDLMRLHIDGEIVGEKALTCSFDEGLYAQALKRICLAGPDENKDILHHYVHGLDVLFQSSAVKNHYANDPPVRLSIDHSSASEIEEDSDGVWSIVGGKASCRRIFSLDVTLLDAFCCTVKEELEVVASLLYADNGVPVENTCDAEPPLLMNCDGVEYDSHDRSSKLINGRASFKLKISQLSSKCENRLFQIRFHIPEVRNYPFLEALSLPIRCVSRNRNTRSASVTFRKLSNRTQNVNGCESPGPDDGSMQLITNIVREAKLSPSSKRIKLGQDNMSFAMFKADARHANKGHTSHAWTANQNTTHGKRRPEKHNGIENNSSASDNSEATNSEPTSMISVSGPIPDLIIFKYCLGSPAERAHLLKETAISATEEQLSNFAKQVSIFSGCLHHWHQIKISKRLVEEGIEAWSSISEANHHVLWENLVFTINQLFMKIASSTRSLTHQDLECLRRIAGCRDVVSEQDFERMWSWLYPVASTLSQTAVNAMWNSTSPIWIQGFISKEEAESSLEGQHPGTFVLRFPTTRTWPHPDAGNLVVTYLANDNSIHHRLLSFDFIYSSSSKEMTVKPLHELLLQEPELSRLARTIRSH